MANEEYLAILKQGVEVWNEWRKNNQGITPVLNESDLSKLLLCEVNLTNINLTKADLSGANLSEANLSMANLSMANLCEANLTMANLNKANLSGANLSKANLSMANLSEANVTEANFSNAKVFQANLSETNLFEANLDKVDLSKAIFNGATAHYSPPIWDTPLGATVSFKTAKEFLDIFSFSENKTELNKLNKRLFTFNENLIPGIILYTEEDNKLSHYIKDNFESLDKLTGDWCTIFLLERPPLGWEKSHLYWKEIFEDELYEKFKFFNFLKNRKYQKSEVYDLARKLKIDINNLPCLVLLNPKNMLHKSDNEYASIEKIVFRIKEVSPEYFRDLFFNLEAQAINSQSAFENIKLNFPKITKILKKYSELEQEARNKTSNYYIANSQFAGGIVDANNVDADQIGGNIQNNDA
ncbi:MAG: pentapeptide repeat-containing protein [Nostoc sp.]|uniref:pentapeptide repeat-containing protein n=1 Tax=Nostoc sp. TaxID=1180 RepID=UPI002FFAE28E